MAATTNELRGQQEGLAVPTPDEALHGYIAMMNEADEERRRELAGQALTEDAVLLYPTFEAHGRAEAVDVVGFFHQRNTGIQILVTSEIEQHHDWLRVAWRVVRPDGSAGPDGQSVGELADDGRLRRIIGFHNPLPPRT